MSNLFDYLDWQGKSSLEERPFNEVDNLLLSTLAYVPLAGAAPGAGEGRCTLQEAASRFLMGDGIRELRDKRDAQLLVKAAESRRFREMELSLWTGCLDREAEEQFGAGMFHMGDGSVFVAYQGTDNSLVGWKEDFNMGFQSPVPSQAEAAKYLLLAAQEEPEVNFRIGGHSKGGNLAVYAAVHAPEELRGRIRAIYNNDGPGFVGPLLESESYLALRNRVHTYVPQSSVVGMLLNHEEAYEVVRSNQHLLLQHDPYSWEVEGEQFVRAERLDSGSILLDYTLRDWIYSMKIEEREGFVDALYEILSASEAETLPELAANWVWSVPRVIRKLHDLDPASRRLIKKALLQLFRSARDTIPAVWLTGMIQRTE